MHITTTTTARRDTNPPEHRATGHQVNEIAHRHPDPGSPSTHALAVVAASGRLSLSAPLLLARPGC
jgi:hypothetical protein